MIVTFVMWVLIAERYWYFATAFPQAAKEKLKLWQQRTDHSSWHAHKIRTAMISELKLESNQFIDTIKTLVAVAPLFGLLGTVTGMVEVFDVMALTGSSNARAMSSGITKATIPTMAGMVAALSGLYFSTQLERRANRAVEKVEDDLPLS
jgi:biopolymer transport protein ExbB